MNPIVLIPARMASTRLPGKPLADIAGVPMIVRVWRQAIAAGVGPVVVAAAEREIAAAIERAGGRAVLTDPDLPSGSDRIFAALRSARSRRARTTWWSICRAICPRSIPPTIRARRRQRWPRPAPISRRSPPRSTIRADFDNPNVVKPVVAWERTDMRGRALYFTRARAPHGDGPLFHHVGIYAFTRDALARFVTLAAVAAGEAREARTIARAGSRHDASRSRAWTTCRSASIRRTISKKRARYSPQRMIAMTHRLSPAPNASPFRASPAPTPISPRAKPCRMRRPFRARPSKTPRGGARWRDRSRHHSGREFAAWPHRRHPSSRRLWP